jgi:uncharacterized membrane protein
MQLVVVMLALAWLALPLWALAAALRAGNELRALRERVRQLEAARATLAAVPPAGSPAPDVPPPLPFPVPAPILTAPEATTTPPMTAPPVAAPAGAPPSQAPPRFFDSARAEEVVGGLWLQNVGAVLVLAGAFFLIVWGWSTGRLGPGALVGAGVVFGLALVWRGLRLARSLPPIGHALAGVGCGVAYVSVYLGHITLHVLGPGAALALLAAVSAGTLALGLRVRAQVIAVLGVLGAFLPLLLPHLLALRGFDVAAGPAVAWVAATDLVVVILAARSGWGSLTLGALALTTAAWVAVFGGQPWTWSQQAALTAMFLGLGLAPVPRLARQPGRLPLAEQAVLVLAPLLFAIASWPFLAYANRIAVSALLVGVAAVFAAAAWWADALSEESDVWRPLTGAASLFVALALERGLGAEHVSVAWLAEGLALAWLGGGRRGTWLRGCGALVSFVGALFLLPLLVAHPAAAAELPFVHADGLRALAGIALLALTALPLRSESRFGESARRALSRGWAIGAVLLLLLYTVAESDHAARALFSSGGRWAKPPALGAPPVGTSMVMLRAFLTSALWTLEAAALMVLGWRRRSGFLRWLGLALLGLTVLKFVIGDLAVVDVFWRFAGAVVVGVTLLLVSYSYQRRMRRERVTR